MLLGSHVVAYVERLRAGAFGVTSLGTVDVPLALVRPAVSRSVSAVKEVFDGDQGCVRVRWVDRGPYGS